MSRRDGTGRKSGSVGSFFFGTFMGFILCLGALIGVGCFAYFKVSPAWINKNFKTNIDLGSEEANNKTISKFVSSAINLAENVDTYTLNNLKDDFGIELEDELFGLDITDLKTVGLSDLPEAIEKKFGSISADELRNINGMNLDDMSKILDKTNVYYYNSTDNKLYKSFNGTNYSDAVEFDYEISSDKSKVVTKKHETSILMNSEHNVVNQVNIPLWYLPLTDALGDFTSNMGNQITLKDLETDYGVTLPDFLEGVDKENTTINELEDAINGLYVADFLGYTIDNTDPLNPIVWNGNDKVTGVMAIVAKEKVENLANLKNTIDKTKIADIMGLDIKQDTSTGSYYDDKDNDNIMDDGEEVATVMNIIADTTVENLTSRINELKLADIFAEEDLSTGALALIPSTTLLTDIATEMNAKFKTVTIGELIENNVIELDTADMAQYTSKKDKYVAGTSTKLKDLKLSEMTSILFDSIPVTDDPMV